MGRDAPLSQQQSKLQRQGGQGLVAQANRDGAGVLASVDGA